MLDPPILFTLMTSSASGGLCGALIACSNRESHFTFFSFFDTSAETHQRRETGVSPTTAMFYSIDMHGDIIVSDGLDTDGDNTMGDCDRACIGVSRRFVASICA